MDAERGVQRQFRMRALAAGLFMVVAVILAHRWLLSFPNRHELGWREARVEFRPLRFDANGFAPQKLAGAWQVTSEIPDVGALILLSIFFDIYAGIGGAT